MPVSHSEDLDRRRKDSIDNCNVRSARSSSERARACCKRLQACSVISVNYTRPQPPSVGFWKRSDEEAGWIVEDKMQK